MQNERKDIRRGVRVALYVMLAAMAIVVLRYAWLQLVEGERDHAQPASRRAALASSLAEYGVRTPSMSR